MDRLSSQLLFSHIFLSNVLALISKERVVLGKELEREGESKGREVPSYLRYRRGVDEREGVTGVCQPNVCESNLNQQDRQ